MFNIVRVAFSNRRSVNRIAVVNSLLERASCSNSVGDRCIMQTFSPLSRSLLMLTAQLSKCINRHQHGRKHGSSSQAQWEFSRGSKIQGLTTPLLPKLTYQMRNSGQTLTYRLSVWIEKKRTVLDENCFTRKRKLRQ